MKEINVRKSLAMAGAGLALTVGLGLAVSPAFGATSPTAQPRTASSSLGKFVPYWQNVEPSPEGCSGPITPGFTVTGPVGCGQDSNGNGLVDFVWLNGGQSFSYSFKVPAGTDAYVSYGIPSATVIGNGTTSINGGYLNNTPVRISVDGGASVTTSKEEGNWGSQCQTIASCIVWQSPALDAGTHTITVTAVHDQLNLYGLWVRDQNVG
jgi:hypothetical protein